MCTTLFGADCEFGAIKASRRLISTWWTLAILMIFGFGLSPDAKAQWLPEPPDVSCSGLGPANRFSQNPIERGQVLKILATGAGGAIYFYYFQVVGDELRLHVRGREILPGFKCYFLPFDTSVLAAGTYKFITYDYTSYDNGNMYLPTPAISGPETFVVLPIGALSQKVPLASAGFLALIALALFALGLRRARAIKGFVLCVLLAPPMANS